MGFRFRKSIKMGPLRFTLSKSGVSSSVGVKGYRVTNTANGRVRRTASIPGTGISYVTESGGKSAAKARRQKKPRGRIGCLPVQDELLSDSLHEIRSELLCDRVCRLFRIEQRSVLELHLHEFVTSPAVRPSAL